jgi:C1A family cysteine protease
MLKLMIVGTVATFAQANLHAINQGIIDEIKDKADTWTPMEIHENPFHHHTDFKILGLMGTHLRGPVEGIPAPQVANGIPTSFDARTQWPSCIHSIRNQQQCGSCWAFGATEALSDRFCIASNGKIDVVLSPEDLVACDSSDMGCNGGWLNNAWNYLTKTGAVSDACFPYSSGAGSVPQCPKTCTASGVTYKKY